MNCTGIAASVILIALTNAPIRSLHAEEAPSELAQLRAAYERDVEFATRPIRDRYRLKLETLKRALGAKGEIKSALAIQEEIDKLRVESESATDLAKFAGEWQISYSNGAVRLYEIKSDGSVTYSASKGKVIGKGKISLEKGEALLEIEKGVIERLVKSGKTLAIDHFLGPANYRAGTPQLKGVGVVASPDKE